MNELLWLIRQPFFWIIFIITFALIIANRVRTRLKLPGVELSLDAERGKREKSDNPSLKSENQENSSSTGVNISDTNIGGNTNISKVAGRDYYEKNDNSK